MGYKSTGTIYRPILCMDHTMRLRLLAMAVFLVILLELCWTSFVEGTIIIDFSMCKVSGMSVLHIY